MWLHVSILVAAFVIVASRRPDAVLNAQFWAEDGSAWYAGAYSQGFHSIFIPIVGYYSLLPRLVAVAVQWIPLQRAPLVFNLVAITLQVLPVSLFVSERFAFAGSLPRRMLLGLVYLGLPNSGELNANLTNAQWHLALLALMVLLAPAEGSVGWAVFDWGVVCLLALTGPFSILLLPVAAVIFWKRRQRRCALLGAMLAGGAVVQSLALFTSTRAIQPVGANWHQFIRITGHQVFLSALFGQTGLWLPDPQPPWYFIVLLVAVLLGTVVIIYALVRGPLELKLFVGFSALVYGCSLQSPLGPWGALHVPGLGARYWFFPMMAFLGSLLWICFKRTTPKKIRWPAILLALTMAVGMVRDWRYRPFTDFHFREHAQRFFIVPRGTPFEIPINPDWKMVLVKK